MGLEQTYSLGDKELQLLASHRNNALASCVDADGSLKVKFTTTS